ncbi:hypothetical protein LCGC14_2499120 [marine sediment metagenome]|uniref:Uncharacterized protein n=1 Tax=marine sediment metagenome TaxID=412755 RepID=A0A0F9DW69_9ZZZZ
MPQGYNDYNSVTEYNHSSGLCFLFPWRLYHYVVGSVNDERDIWIQWELSGGRTRIWCYMMEDIENVELPEIEVTPEMIAAGADVIVSVTFDLADEDFWAEQVYRAMAAKKPCVAGSSASRD